jgi:hypothetical protein
MDGHHSNHFTTSAFSWAKHVVKIYLRVNWISDLLLVKEQEPYPGMDPERGFGGRDRPPLDHQIFSPTNLWTIAKETRSEYSMNAIHLRPNFQSQKKIQQSVNKCHVPHTTPQFYAKILPPGLAWNRISEHLDLNIFPAWLETMIVDY